MKVIRSTSVIYFAPLLASLLFFTVPNASAQHGFSVPQYEHFHDLLHPLEHEALPKKDFRRIRNKSAELVKRGKAIVKVGVPAGTKDEQKEEFAKELKRFEKALAKFRADARNGNNNSLKNSYSAVHDSFEMLAGMLPRG